MFHNLSPESLQPTTLPIVISTMTTPPAADRRSVAANARSKRLGFTKSRKGCTRCKQRRVKGDLAAATASSTSSPQPTSGTAHSALLDSLDPSENSDCWISNAELLIHYTTVTYRTFSFTASLSKFLQSDLPREALSHPFLLRELMAFAGFHLAYLHPDKCHGYLVLASKHQDLAIKSLRENLSKPMTSQNCHSLYLTSIFLILGKFAAFTATEPQHRLHGCLAPIKGLLEIFSMVHGMDGVFRSAEHDIRLGPLEGLFGDGPHAQDNTCVLSLSSRLQELKVPVASEIQDGETSTTLVSAIDSLIAAAVKTANYKAAAPAELRTIFLWPMIVPRHFVGLAEAGNPIALLILAHYCVLIRWAAEKSWCFEHWATAVSKAIARQVSSSSWAAWLAWPLGLINESIQGVNSAATTAPPLVEDHQMEA